MKETSVIDFVVPWVDNSDPIWRAKKAQYTGVEEQEGNTDARYRDWDILKYWFRGIDKFAPWVRYVHFITDDQKPEWLNIEHSKLKWVKHTDYIPAEYLPTFNSHTIEWNIHKIKDLSEHFVYFNDDMFIIKETKPEDFFVDGLPCDLPDLGPLYPTDFFSNMLFNNICLLNRHFSLKKSIQANPKKWIQKQSLGGLFKLMLYGRKDLIPNSNSRHIHISYNKKTYETLWKHEAELIDATCQHKLRTKDDITPWCLRDWQLFSGEFYPKKPIGKLFHTSSISHSDEAINYLKKQKGKIICLNDSEDETDFELHKKMIVEAFEKILPEKSSFEI
ncbi:MAG: capsule biosynthesis protein CapK [Ruminococcaceae bacterium]|nr:capsule biosynthesis protein CapK [Oscillospiraceae bacterium]